MQSDGEKSARVKVWQNSVRSNLQSNLDQAGFPVYIEFLLYQLEKHQFLICPLIV